MPKSDKNATSPREIRWLSAVDLAHRGELEALESRMEKFYTTNATYYSDIDFSHTAWDVDNAFQSIKARCGASEQILEVGCGTAKILRHTSGLEKKYHGCDFSPDLIHANALKYARAEFAVLTSPRKFPYPDRRFDCVFSVFVLEHVVFPQYFLDECTRVLRPGGTLALRFPNFLDRGAMTSQAAGFSEGTGRKKILSGRMWDAIMTGYDRKVRIPGAARQRRAEIGGGHKFFINVNPLCFQEAFQLDYDSVYLTFRPEIESYLGNSVTFDRPDPSLDGPDIYMQGVKKLSP